MTEKHFILATAGHVDHGKSALVKALTGTDPDRLPEEKARGITIELGFAQLILNPPNEQRLCIGIVDVPGHEDFVRNMIAGVGSVDLALLVVAADDGWMPQTEEHLQILNYLGVKRAVIALTKSDLGKIDNVATEIRNRLGSTAFANSPLIPTSTRPNQGIEELKRALCVEFSDIQPQRNIAKPRLFVDRAFTLRGIGTVVTGTLTGGMLRRGQSVVAQRLNLSARIRSIQNHGCDRQFAEPGMRTAINLPDAAIGPTGAAIKRGDVVTIANLGSPTATLDVLLARLPRQNSSSPAARPLKNGAAVYVHHGTTRVPAKVELLEDGTLAGGDEAIAQLRLKSPLFAFLGDRFVIRDPSEQFTIGGGVVLDPRGDRKDFRDPAQRALLTARARAAHDVNVCAQSELTRYGFTQSKTLLPQSNFSAEEIATALIFLEEQGTIVLHGEIAADAEQWRALFRRARTSIDDAHQRHPEQRGLELVELRAQLHDQSSDVFEALVFDLCANGFVRERSTIARRSHRATLPAQIQPAAQRIRAALAAKPFDPPGREEMAKDQNLRQALRFLIEQGEVIEVTSDIVLLREASEDMCTAVVAFISQSGPASTSSLRQHLGTSRRIVIPFLEYLDRSGVTRRTGDTRQLQKSAAIAQQ
jgi:selenocysteine-specific elongation factor